MLNKLLNEVESLINGKNIFITGGTGTFGHKITEIILNNYQPNKIIIFSRDEFKQYNMKQIFPENKHKNIRYFIGDVRDYERLLTATKDVDIIFHAAAMKQVDTIEYNPLEAIKELIRITNVNGLIIISTPYNFRIHGPLYDTIRFSEWFYKNYFSKDKFEILQLIALEDVNRKLFPISYFCVIKKL
jgi:SAM-dependent methyltransferase